MATKSIWYFNCYYVSSFTMFLNFILIQKQRNYFDYMLQISNEHTCSFWAPLYMYNGIMEIIQANQWLLASILIISIFTLLRSYNDGSLCRASFLTLSRGIQNRSKRLVSLSLIASGMNFGNVLSHVLTIKVQCKHCGSMYSTPHLNKWK